MTFQFADWDIQHRHLHAAGDIDPNRIGYDGVVRGQDAAQAVPYLQLAGQLAAQRYAYAEAVGHLRQGVQTARDARLPEAVIELIEQHHGTQVVEYFFQKALKLKSREIVREQDFRYPGPKPHTIEAALLMIADAVEAASRTLKVPGRAAFDKLVRFIIVKRIADGQFGECVLDTRDIEAITHAMVDALEASFHARIRYPWQQPSSVPDPAVRRAG